MYLDTTGNIAHEPLVNDGIRAPKQASLSAQRLRHIPDAQHVGLVLQSPTRRDPLTEGVCKMLYISAQHRVHTASIRHRFEDMWLCIYE